MSKSWGEIREEALRRCGQLPPKTNADRIRAMTDEELADWFSSIAEEAVKSGGKIKSSCWLDWLKQEATDVN